MDDFYYEIFDACNKIFGQEVSFRSKKELAESISVIFQNYFGAISNQTSNLNSNINIYITPNFPMFPTIPNMNSSIPNMNSTYSPNPYYIPMLPFQPPITPVLPQIGYTPIQPMNMFNMYPFNNPPNRKRKKSKKAISRSPKISTEEPNNSEQKIPEQNVADQSNSPIERPANAFILYSQAKRSEVSQQNPKLSNTEVSRILGKMWKEVPNDVKLQYKSKAQKLQEEFKKNHPDYTYRKARRKKTLDELLSKSSSSFIQRSQNENENNESNSPKPFSFGQNRFSWGKS